MQPGLCYATAGTPQVPVGGRESCVLYALWDMHVNRKFLDAQAGRHSPWPVGGLLVHTPRSCTSLAALVTQTLDLYS